jgi:uncharacterized damage-inducible protein DinB
MFDRDALRELFEYAEFTWNSYGRTLAKLPDDAFTREIPGSGWADLRHALFHVALAWDGWAYERFGLTLPELEHQDVANWNELTEHRTRVRSLMRRALDETDDETLAARNVPMWEDTPARQLVSIGDVLAHVLLHERGHHGDISTLFSQLGAEPPNMDYLIYRFFKSRERKTDA